VRLWSDSSGRLDRSGALLLAAELLLLALIAVQAARLVWLLATPRGPVGDWRPVAAGAASAGAEVLRTFDPFFRLEGAPAPAVVTSLNLRLFGVREDRATGRGAAIIGLPDGTQRSFAVGEEILPGVTLAEVGFDSITVRRGGRAEQLFLNQSSPAPSVSPAAPQPQTAPPAASQPPAPGEAQPVRANAT
jgi:general secretion pathway protein C